ncbi:putative oxidoreductase OrdL [Vanrija pseudolonga]|uniref:Oxidoreductase OrdL n=1 Tax=Vanrija pseudolonga TaxID=143232 RepID=A0AAF1BIT1_9TREE|nr:putative oxidoreductase OrdL [Vanrija pseudolonga]
MPLPRKDPTKSYWIEQAPSPLKDFQSGPLPERTDVLIIGAGYTAATLAYWLRAFSPADAVPSITVLDARDICGGATGRNGGQLRPISFDAYADWAATYGRDTARELIEHEVAHIPAFEALVAAEKLDCDLHVSRTWSAYMTDEEAAKGVAQVEGMRAAEGGWVDRVVGDVVATRDPEEAGRLTRVKGARGAVGVPGGRIWPYKFVHGLFAKLLQTPGFELHAHTPAVEVLPCRNSNMEWTVATARGDIRAKAVVYANNRWVEHLAPEFRGVITAARNQMAAIRLDGSRWAGGKLDEQAMQFWDGLHNNYYVTFPQYNTLVIGGAKQVLVRPTTRPDGSAGPPDLSLWHDNDDEDKNAPGAEAYFRSWPQRDLVGWGGPSEAKLAGTNPSADASTGGLWTGVMSHSIDSMPFVGPLDCERVAAGQYVAAGWNGHGMPRILLATHALAGQVLAGLGVQATPGPEWARRLRIPRLPAPFEVSPERLRRVTAAAREHAAAQEKAKAKL